MLETRIDALEREVRRLRLGSRRLGWGFLLAGFVVAVAAASSPPAATVPDVTQTRRLEVLDSSGKLRAIVDVSDEGPAVALLDEKGNARATLSLSGDVPGLQLLDEKGTRRAWFDVSALGPEFLLSDEKGNKRTTLDVLGDGPALDLFDVNGNHRAALGVTSFEGAKAGEKGTTAESSLLLFDKDGKVLWQAP